MSIEIVILVTTSGLIGLIILFNVNRRWFDERRMVQRRVAIDRRLYDRGRRAQDCLYADVVDDNRFVRRSGSVTRRHRFRRKEDRLAVNEKKILP